jgi:hypothetical protein
MSAWIFKAEANRRLTLRTQIDYFQEHFVGKAMDSSWTPPPIRIEGKSLPVRDFVSWMMSAPVISEKARGVLQPLLIEHCEILPLIELRRKMYYAINVLTMVDCLDEEKSDILYAPDDPEYVLSISRFILRENKIPGDVAIFKIPQDVGVVFATKRFVDAVKANQLRGAMFLDPAASQFGKLLSGESLNVIPDLPQG